ncbi:MAG: ROK family protein [Pseudorhizobium sp.]
MERSEADGLIEILGTIARGRGTTRTDLQQVTGLSRVTLTTRLNQLLQMGLVTENNGTIPSGGRPRRALSLNPKCGFLLVGDVGEAYIRLAAVSLEFEILAETSLAYSAQQTPQDILEVIALELEALVAGLTDRGQALGLCLSLPAPVDHQNGIVVGPSVLPGWDDLRICDILQARLGFPVLVENDVNLMTLSEFRQNYPSVDVLYFVKVGTGIGSGMIANGALFRGAQGAAGDIGHIQFIDQGAPLCRCGKLGCIEARAAGWALARELTALGLEASDARDVLAHVKAGRPEAIMHLRNAGRTIGEVISDVVSIINPRVIVVGGTLAEAGELLVSGLREMVYRRCLPLATRELRIEIAKPDNNRALMGASYLLHDRLVTGDGLKSLVLRSVAHG